MRYNGRIQVGCDANITIFDTDRINDRATYNGGLEFSEGIHHVLVNEKFVILNGQMVKETFPGQLVYGKYKR